MKPNKQNSDAIIDLNKVPAQAKPFIDKIIVPYLKLKYGKDATSYNQEEKTHELSIQASYLMEDVEEVLRNLFHEFRQERKLRDQKQQKLKPKSKRKAHIKQPIFKNN